MTKSEELIRRAFESFKFSHEHWSVFEEPSEAHEYGRKLVCKYRGAGPSVRVELQRITFMNGFAKTYRGSLEGLEMPNDVYEQWWALAVLRAEEAKRASDDEKRAKTVALLEQCFPA